MEHAITEGLTRGKGNVDFRLLVIGGQSHGPGLGIRRSR
jgi:hypothetical protein